MENTIDSMLSYTPVYDEEITKSFENNFSRIKGKWQANCTIFTFSVSYRYDTIWHTSKQIIPMQ